MNSRFSPSWTSHFLELAILVSTRSKDPDAKCGAVIVDSDRRVISTGYNGFPRGVRDDPARYAERGVKLAMVVHAEANAILAARSNIDGSALIVTRAPCTECVKLILQAGVATVVSPAPRPTSKWASDWIIGKEMMLESGVTWEEVELPRGGMAVEQYIGSGLRMIRAALRAGFTDDNGRRHCGNDTHSDSCECGDADLDRAEEIVALLLGGHPLPKEK